MSKPNKDHAKLILSDAIKACGGKQAWSFLGENIQRALICEQIVHILLIQGKHCDPFELQATARLVLGMDA